MSCNANSTDVVPTVPSLRYQDTLQVADANENNGTQLNNTEIDLEVPNWLVAEYKTGYRNTLKALRFLAMI